MLLAGCVGVDGDATTGPGSGRSAATPALPVERAAHRVFELPHSLRMAATGDRLYGAWFASSTVEVRELPSGRALDPLELEGYDDYIRGMAATDDGRLVVSGPDFGRVVVIFDAQTGARLRALPLDRQAGGLSCVTRADREASDPDEPDDVRTSPSRRERRAPRRACRRPQRGRAGVRLRPDRENGPRENRTPNPLIKSQLLCQLS